MAINCFINIEIVLYHSSWKSSVLPELFGEKLSDFTNLLLSTLTSVTTLEIKKIESEFQRVLSSHWIHPSPLAKSVFFSKDYPCLEAKLIRGPWLKDGSGAGRLSFPSGIINFTGMGLIWPVGWLGLLLSGKNWGPICNIRKRRCLWR